ncbi:MAG: CRISPR-associated helicase Cas3' [Xanthomonadales bacterium]|nr:CRISPR-associated helicase Cas3' [Xanthomonadales bacterium]
MKNSRQFFKYWGKAGESGDLHPLPFHSMDVAATGLAVLDNLRFLRNKLEHLSGLAPQVLRSWLGFFLAIHDLGKFSSAFQQLRKDVCLSLKREYFYTIRHDTLGLLAWRDLFADDDKVFERLGTWPDNEKPVELIDSWVQCVTGHHGQPPSLQTAPILDHFSSDDIGAMREWVSIAADLFLPESPPVIDGNLDDLERGMAEFSWYLAGLCTLADWLGSNRDRFPYCNEAMQPTDYFRQHALPNARRAVADSGLLPVKTAEFSAPERLFEFLDNPTPLQQACLDLTIGTGPRLYILEDVTGAGKTEAAFVLLARIMAANQAQGAYIALPTMATANAMYARTAGVYRKLYRQSDQLPSLVLAHGGRHLDQKFRASIIHSDLLPSESQYGPDEFDAEARCNAWLADNNKKALLAQLGVGTIDQALLAVLQSRHQSLRLLGLIGKVLVVDEVHASDAYMHTLLCQLLTMHARAGGSAILLSATLPDRMRDDLVHAFDGCPGEGSESPETLHYPLLTTVSPSKVPIHRPVDTRDSVRRTLAVELHHDENQSLDWVMEQARRGRCVAWIRNTVNDAINAWQCLTEALGEQHVTLFHARFAMGDRLDIEREVLDAFGPGSSADTRVGRVVIATQVIEQSLDLDFDEMVSDLAPIDLLIQRAGRLKRHLRDANGKRLGNGEPDQRGAPCLRVLSPSPDDDVDDRWIRRLLPGTGAVYPDHGRLWLTAKTMSMRGRIRVPEDLRDLLEAVYGESAIEQIPEALVLSNARAEGKALSDHSVARLNAIKTATGYACRDGQWADESVTPTRLGEPMVTIRLGRWNNGTIAPWSDGQASAWSLSEVKIAARLFNEPVIEEPALQEALEELRAGWPKATRYIHVLPLSSQNGHWLSTVRDSRGRLVRFQYSPIVGLRIVKEESQ